MNVEEIHLTHPDWHCVSTVKLADETTKSGQNKLRESIFKVLILIGGLLFCFYLLFNVYLISKM